VLAKSHRFHGRHSLNHVYRKGVTVRSPYCAMRYASNRDGYYRVAVVVSKKVSKHATKRNRIRRRIYEVVRLLAPKYLSNQDIVVSVFDDRILTLEYSELYDSIERQLSQLSKHHI
jgi:ribonuclease P protein component